MKYVFTGENHIKAFNLKPYFKFKNSNKLFLYISQKTTSNAFLAFDI